MRKKLPSSMDQLSKTGHQERKIHLRGRRKYYSVTQRYGKQVSLIDIIVSSIKILIGENFCALINEKSESVRMHAERTCQYLGHQLH